MPVSEGAVQSELRKNNVDVLIGTSRKNIFYSSGIWSTPTVTAGPENYERTGMYHDWEPPKTLVVWSAEEGGPFLVLPPWIAMSVEDEANDIDIPHENIYVYDFSASLNVPYEDRLRENDRRAIELLEEKEGYDTREEALLEILEPLTDSNSTIAIETDNEQSYVYQSVANNADYETIVDGLYLFYELRKVKRDEEIDLLRRAAEINDEAIRESMDELEEGMTERELMKIYKTKIYQKGAIEQIPTEHHMIGFGPHSSYQHTVPGDRPIQKGDLIRFEVGCRYERYPADLARAFIFGEQNDRLSTKYDVLYEGMEKCRELLGEGLNTADVYHQTVDHIRQTAEEQDVPDLKDFDMSMIGHNIGLDIHDPPLISAKDRELEPGMVMNYEVYSQEVGVGNIHLEDTLLLTEDGVEDFVRCPESLQVY